MGPLDSESNYRRPFESPFKVLDWLLRGNGEVLLMLKRLRGGGALGL